MEIQKLLRDIKHYAWYKE